MSETHLQSELRKQKETLRFDIIRSQMQTKWYRRQAKKLRRRIKRRKAANKLVDELDLKASEYEIKSKDPYQRFRFILYGFLRNKRFCDLETGQLNYRQQAEFMRWLHRSFRFAGEFAYKIEAWMETGDIKSKRLMSPVFFETLVEHRKLIEEVRRLESNISMASNRKQLLKKQLSNVQERLDKYGRKLEELKKKYDELDKNLRK